MVNIPEIGLNDVHSLELTAGWNCLVVSVPYVVNGRDDCYAASEALPDAEIHQEIGVQRGRGP